MQTDHPRRSRPQPEPAAPSPQEWEEAMEGVQANLQVLLDGYQQWWKRAATTFTTVLAALEAEVKSGAPARGEDESAEDAVSAPIVLARLQGLQEDCQALLESRQEDLKQVRARALAVDQYLKAQLQTHSPAQVAAELESSQAWQALVRMPAISGLHHQVVNGLRQTAQQLDSLIAVEHSQLQLSASQAAEVAYLAGEADTLMPNDLVFDRIMDATRVLVPGKAPLGAFPNGEAVPSGRPELQGGELQARQSTTRAGYDAPRGAAVAGEFQRGPVPASSPLGPDSESRYGPPGPAE